MLKSMAIVIGCYLLSVVLVFCSDPLLSLLFPGDFVRGRIPSSTALMASTAFFVMISIFCAWLCARFSAKPVKTVLWFLLLGEAMGLVFTIPNWNKGWPHWYWLSWLIAWPFSCWIGLMLGGRDTSQAAAASS